MIIVQKIRLDLFLQSRSTVTVAKQGDIDSRFLEATICANGKPVVVPSNSAASLNMTRSDGMTNSTICTCNDDGTVTIPLIQWALALPGDIYCSLSISTESEKLTTLSFRVKVERSEYNENQIVVYSVYEESLDPGTYHIRIAGNSYQFTTSYAVPVGGVIRFNTILTKAYTYSTESLESEIEADINLVEGTGGTELVTSGEATIINELANEIANKVPITRTINSKSLESNVVLNASDIPNDSSVSGANVDDALNTLDDNKVPITRTINSKSLETDIVLNSTDIENDSSIFDGDNISEVFESIDGKIDEVVSDIDSKLDQKANVDGYYETLGAGTADQLISPDGVTNTPETDAEYNPFVFRPTGGNMSISSGNASIEQIRGSSIVWNQLARTSSKTDTLNGLTFVRTSTKITVSGTAEALTNYSFQSLSNMVVGHKLLLFGCPAIGGSSSSYSYRLRILDSSGTGVGSEYGNGIIVEMPTTTGSLRIGVSKNTEIDPAITFVPQLFDLTQMFGPTVADQIYAMETATAGSGVAYFRSIFPLSYYEYDPGTIKNITANTLRTVEFNQFNKDNYSYLSGYFTSADSVITTYSSSRRIVYIPCFPNTKYCATKIASATNARFVIGYTEELPKVGTRVFNSVQAPNSQTIGSRITISTTTGPFAKYLVVWVYWESDQSGAIDSLCINLSHSGYRDGEYEPYKTHELSLPISTYFPDGMNGVDTVYDEINFKIRKVIKRYGIVDLGTLTWSYNPDYLYFYATISGIKISAKAICAIYTQTYVSYAGNQPDMTMKTSTSDNHRIFITNKAYTSQSTFKTAMSGVYLIYELDTPVEINIPESVNNTYIESDFGTEEFVYSETDIPIKVPCEITYIDNLRDKLRNLNPMTTSELNEVLTILD